MPALSKLEASGDIKLGAIVNTHHHYDHSGGNAVLAARYPGLPVIAGANSPLVSTTPAHNATLRLGQHVIVTALHTPCHTADSICYYAEDTRSGEKAVFTGDTLFVAGCGRFFEGSAAQMDASLNRVLGGLPDDTRVYPGHEYTKSNVRFVETVMESAALRRLAAYVAQHEKTTGVFTIGDEKGHNPFMRLADPQLQKATNATDRTEVMKKLRELKNKM